MKISIFLSLLFLLAVAPVMAKNPIEPGSKPVTTIDPVRKATVSPAGNQVKNQNEQLNQTADENTTKVSDQVHQLIETVGAKGGIGQQVKVIAQSQTKLQDEIKSDFANLNTRGTIAKLLIGSDKKITKSLEQKLEQNRLMVQQLEELKLQTKNPGDLQQLQQTIDSMTNQNISLQDKIDKESKVTGFFGWLVNLFNKT